MTCSDDDFKSVDTDSFVRNPCSPEAPDDPYFQGILIDAPAVVEFRRGERVGPFGTFAFIPVCGFFRLETTHLPPSESSFHEAMRLVAEEQQTGLVFIGPLARPPELSRPRGRGEAAAGEASDLPPGLTVGGYFNSNLAEHVRLAEVTATYDIHIELGDRESEGFVRSNTVTVEVRETFG